MGRRTSSKYAGDIDSLVRGGKPSTSSGGEEGEVAMKFTNALNTDNTAQDWALLRNDRCEAQAEGVSGSALSKWDASAKYVTLRDPLRREEEIERKYRAAWTKGTRAQVAGVGGDVIATGTEGG